MSASFIVIAQGEITMATINLKAAGQRDLAKGMRGDDVKRWQEFLKEQGFDPGAVTGIFNTQTQQATIAFQRDRGLSGTGIVDEETRQQITLDERSPSS
jgi:peptidoglycan hydrolase-like protein with peptidoglycan-binding domain